MKLVLVSILFSLTSVNATEVRAVKLTWYWKVHNKDVQPSAKTHSVFNQNGEQIAKVEENLLKKIWMEGSGYLPDGTLINLVKPKEFHNSTYMKVDKEKYPWGLDARGKGLQPMKTVAVDPEVIPLGSKIYIPEFKHSINGHDGCFLASDTGHSFKGNYIDIFSGTKDAYLKLEKKLKTWKRNVRVFINHENC